MLREGVWLKISLWLSFPKRGPDGTPASPAVKSGETSNRAVVPGRFFRWRAILRMATNSRAWVRGRRQQTSSSSTSARPGRDRVSSQRRHALGAAEQCPPPAPATACDDVPGGHLGDEVCPIAYEHRIDAEGSLECRFDLRRRVVRSPESVYRARDQLA